MNGMMGKSETREFGYYCGNTDAEIEIRKLCGNKDIYNGYTYFTRQDTVNKIKNEIAEQKFLVVFGRKGSGKTYLAERIKDEYTSEKKKCVKIAYDDVESISFIISSMMSENGFPNQKWKLISLIILLQLLLQANDCIEADPKRKWEDKLKKIYDDYSILVDDDLKILGRKKPTKTTKQTESSNSGKGGAEVNWVIFKASGGGEHIVKKSDGEVSETIESHFASLIKELENLLNDIKLVKTFLILFDNLDEALYRHKDKDDLETFIYTISILKEKKDYMEVIFFLRSDANMLESSYRQKIKNNQSMDIDNWDEASLRDMLKKRLLTENIPLDELLDKKIEVIVGRNPWGMSTHEYPDFQQYLISLTFYRPRDFIALLNAYQTVCEMKKQNPHVWYLDALCDACNLYADEYLIGIIADELRSFWETDGNQARHFIEALAVAMSGKDLYSSLEGFTPTQFYRFFDEFSQDKDIGVNKHAIFNRLIKIGVFGQWKLIDESEHKYSWRFNYMPNEHCNSASEKYILHKALRCFVYGDRIKWKEVDETKKR